MRTKQILILASVSLSIIAAQASAAPRVDIVTAKGAPKLERVAAQELAEHVKKVFKAEPVVSDKLPAKAEHAILVGSPATNPAVAQAAGKGWPKLTDQGIALKTVAAGDKKLLLVGGGSPAATLWAVSELAHSWGVRSMPSADCYPASLRDYEAPKLDLAQEPAWRVRAWRAIDDSPLGFQSWPLADQQKLLKQLAKLKFNRIVLALDASQPFAPAEARGKDGAVHLFRGERFPIERDSAGRTAFGNATEFTNPDLAGKKSPQELSAAGTTLAKSLIETAQGLGMSVGIQLDTAAGPDALARIKSCLKAYPAVDALYLKVDLANTDAIAAGMKNEHLLERSGQPARELNFVTPDGLRIIPREVAGVSASGQQEQALPHSYVLRLTDDSIGVLPQVHTRRLHRMLGDLKDANVARKVKEPGSGGYLVSAQMVGDAEPALYFLSRAGFDGAMTPDKAYQELYTAVCGQAEPAARMREACDSIEKANDILDAELPKLGLPRPGMLRAAQRGELSAEAIAGALKEYSHGMDEVYRAHGNCQDNGRPFLYYYAKRGEFSLWYMTCIDALSKAADAVVEGKPDVRDEQIDAATEALFTGLECVREVARDQGDRACIAVLNKYAYKPLISGEADSAQSEK